MKHPLFNMLFAVLAGACLGFGAARLSSAMRAPDSPPQSPKMAAEAIDTAPIVRIDAPGTDDEDPSGEKPKKRGNDRRQATTSHKSSLPAVVRELEKLRTAPAGKERKQKQSDLLDEWIALDPAGAANWAANLFASGGDEQLLRKAVRAYAQHDPHSAVAWASSLASPLVRDSAVREIFEAWSARDLRSASEEVPLLPIGSAQTTAATVVAKNFARIDFEGALAWMGSLVAPTQGSAFQTIMRTQWARTGSVNPGAALPWLLSQPSLSFREQGIRFIAGEWAKRDPLSALANAALVTRRTDRNLFLETALRTFTQTNPREAALWLAGQPPSPETERLMNQVTAAWTAFEPQETARWAGNLQNPVLRAKSITSVAESWAKVDPDGLVDWLGSLADATTRDAALEGATRVWMREDPAAAAQWAAGIVDRGRRDYSITQIVREWKNHNTAAALAFVQSTPAIDNNLRQRLLR